MAKLILSSNELELETCIPFPESIVTASMDKQMIHKEV